MARDSLRPQSLLVAIFDVLGFRSEVERRSLAGVLATYNRLLKGTRRATTYDSNDSLWSPLDVFLKEVPNLVLSDTIALWANIQNAGPFLFACGRLMTEGLMLGWPLRGAISAGELIAHRRRGIILGKPLVRALEIERTCDWVGVAVDGDVLRQIEGRRTTRTATAFNIPVEVRDGPTTVSLMRYDVPVKSASDCLRWALDWAIERTPCRQALDELRTTSPRDVEFKYSNALAFLGYCERTVSLCHGADFKEKPTHA